MMRRQNSGLRIQNSELKMALVVGLLFLPLLFAQPEDPPTAAASVPAAKPARPVKPGVKTPGVQIPTAELKPEAVFEVPGSPDWQAVGEDAMWVSNKPKDSV